MAYERLNVFTVKEEMLSGLPREHFFFDSLMIPCPYVRMQAAWICGLDVVSLRTMGFLGESTQYRASVKQYISARLSIACTRISCSLRTDRPNSSAAFSRGIRSR